MRRRSALGPAPAAVVDQPLMRDGVSAVLQSLFRVRPDELRRTGYAFIYLFAAIGAFIIGRVARTVLFLEIPNYREQLPMVYVGIAVAVSISMYIYARLERSLRRDATNSVTLVVLAVVTLGFRSALHDASHTVYWAFYVWVELLGSFLIVQFWSLANEIFHSRQAKRLFAVIGGGGVLANVVVGFAVSKTVHTLGTENLLYLIAVCLCVCLAMVGLLGRNASSELTSAHARIMPSRGPVATPQRVFSTRHVRLIAAVVTLTYLASYLLDYQFNIIVGDSIALKDDRSAFLGNFFGVTGIIGGFLQFFLTARLLERFGVLFTLLMLPVALMGGSTALLTVPGLWAVTASKGAENVLRYTVNDTTLQLLYLPLPTALRGRAKAVIDGIFKQLSIGVAGILLALLVGQLDKLAGISLGFTLDVYKLSWLVVATLVAWVFTLLGLRREYLKSLVQTLQRRRLNLGDARFEINDPSMAGVLDTALSSDKMEAVLHGLELLPSVSAKIRAPLDAKAVGLLLHQVDAVRVAALNYLGGTGTQLHGEAVGKLLDDPSAEVRASATLAFCALRREDSLGKVHHMLDDPDAKVRAHAVAGLIRHGGLDGILACADRLKRMFTSEEAGERVLAAWVLGEVGVQNFYQPLVPLFRFDNDAVRAAAIVAAGKLRSPELVPHLIGQLDHPRLSGAAAQALALHGQSIAGTIAGLLADTNRSSRVRSATPRILARLLEAGSVDTLCRHLLDDDVHVRAAVVQTLSSLRSRVPGIRIDMQAVAAALRGEARGYVELLAMSADLHLDERVLLLSDALQHRQNQTQSRLLALLALKYPGDTIDLVARNLKSTQLSIRANAVEVVDNLLDKEEKLLVMPLIDDTNPPEAKLHAGTQVFDVRRSDRTTRLRELLTGRDDWLRICAALAAGEWRVTNLQAAVESLLRGDNPVAREAAMLVLGKLSEPEALRELLKPLVNDAVPAVRKYAEHMLADVTRRPASSKAERRPVTRG